jgi:hypothetical protein
MSMCRHQSAGQNVYIKVADNVFENVTEFKHLGTALTNHKTIRWEIKSRLNSGRACYHAAQNLSCSRLLPRNVKIK